MSTDPRPTPPDAAALIERVHAKMDATAVYDRTVNADLLLLVDDAIRTTIVCRKAIRREALEEALKSCGDARRNAVRQRSLCEAEGAGLCEDAIRALIPADAAAQEAMRDGE